VSDATGRALAPSSGYHERAASFLDGERFKVDGGVLME